jgi:hypothetical protein
VNFLQQPDNPTFYIEISLVWRTRTDDQRARQITLMFNVSVNLNNRSLTQR